MRHTHALATLALIGCAGGNTTPTPPATKTIAGIAITGQPVKVFDHTTDQQSPNNIPDAQTTAWKEADGTVNLMIAASDAYRMRGPDFTHLVIDPHIIYSSDASASQIPENLDNYAHWLMGPYSLDGQTFYSITHSEWYACLLDNDCSANGYVSQGNSWVASSNAFVSHDGGASWQLNTAGGTHIAFDPGYHWTGTLAFQDTIWAYADNHTGTFQPTRVVHEGAYFYCIAFYIHRDFTQINPSQGVYGAPVDATGYVLLRTADITSAAGWQAWTGGSTFQPVANGQFQTFSPEQNGSPLSAAPPQIIYDTTAKQYILIFTLFGGSNPVYYMTTTSLATPSWSDAVTIGGTAGLVTDPAGNIVGFNDGNYTSIIDASSPGYNFEFTGGSPMLFYSTFPANYGGDNIARDLYRVQLSITYR